MREMLLSTPVTGIFICLAAYELGVQINKKLKTPIANPMLIGIVLAAAVLSVCNIPLEAFDLGGDMINMLLTPATAVIGLSIYRQRKVLQENFLPMVLGCLVGSLTNVALIHGLCKLFMLEDSLLYSLLPRSVTTPIAVALSEQCGGHHHRPADGRAGGRHERRLHWCGGPAHRAAGRRVVKLMV